MADFDCEDNQQHPHYMGHEYRQVLRNKEIQMAATIHTYVYRQNITVGIAGGSKFGCEKRC